MEDVPEYQLVFLNELHEILKLLDPRRSSTAGLFRILGRLIDFDINTQIAKIESCFHAQYTSSPPNNTGHSNRVISINSNNSNTPHLTNNGIKQKEHCQRNTGSKSSYECIDLTSSADKDDTVDDQAKVKSDNRSSGKSTKIHVNSSITPVRTRGGPKVILWVDTRLLGPWKFDLKGLFQFMGEVTYEAGHWVLCARTFRNMEGLDLHTYHQSILLTRALMKEHQERLKSREPNIVHLID